MLARFFIILISLYQKGVSPYKPRACRFWPSCSQYAKEALSHYGFLRGGVKTLTRLLKCHPLHPGGYDPVIIKGDILN